MTQYDVLGIGNAIVDVLTKTDDAFLTTNGIEKGAMTLIDTAAADALYAKMGPGVEVSGGSAANTMAGVASLGGKGAYIGKVAKDQLGEVFTHDIRSGGLAFTTAPSVNGAPTARCLILVTPDAQRLLLRTWEGVLVYALASGQSAWHALNTEACLAPTAEEPQGEAVAATDDGFFTLSEGAGATLWRTVR